MTYDPAGDREGEHVSHDMTWLTVPEETIVLSINDMVRILELVRQTGVRPVTYSAGEAH